MCVLYFDSYHVELLLPDCCLGPNNFLPQWHVISKISLSGSSSTAASLLLLQNRFFSTRLKKLFTITI